MKNVNDENENQDTRSALSEGCVLMLCAIAGALSRAFDVGNHIALVDMCSLLGVDLHEFSAESRG